MCRGDLLAGSSAGQRVICEAYKKRGSRVPVRHVRAIDERERASSVRVLLLRGVQVHAPGLRSSLLACLLARSGSNRIDLSRGGQTLTEEVGESSRPAHPCRPCVLSCPCLWRCLVLRRPVSDSDGVHFEFPAQAARPETDRLRHERSWQAVGGSFRKGRDE